MACEPGQVFNPGATDYSKWFNCEQMVFVFDSVSGYTDISQSYPATVDNPASDQPQARIQATGLPEGTYMFGLSATSTSFDIAQPAVFRFSMDGGQNWEEAEADLGLASEPHYGGYQFPTIRSGDQDLIVQVKSKGVPQVDVAYLNIWLQRVA